MPTYTFKCLKCKHEFDKFQGMTEPNPTCPRMVYGLQSDDPQGKLLEPFDFPCGSPTEKLITGSSFILKGDGWASDGYGGGGTNK